MYMQNMHQLDSTHCRKETFNSCTCTMSTFCCRCVQNWCLCMSVYTCMCGLLVRTGSVAHSMPDPVASVWVVGIPPPVFAGKTQGEYLAVCLSPLSPALVDRRTHTSRSFVKWFPCANTHVHAGACTQHTHTALPPFTLAYLFLVVCILLLSWRWHTCVRTHKHVHS